MQESYDVLFAIRLDADLDPIEATEAPREAVEADYPTSRVRWGRRSRGTVRVRHIGAAELTAPWTERTK